MSKFATVTRSHTAAVSVNGNLRGQMEKARGSWVGKALLVSSLVIPFLFFAVPWVGNAISYAFDMRRNRVIEKKQKEVLTDYYRDQVATQLGIDPKTVSVGDLELAAKVNPMIAGAINKVNAEKKSANRGAAMATAGAAAVGWIPGVNAITNVVAHGAVHMGGAVAGGVVSSLFDKDVLHVQDMVEHLDAQRAEGKQITPEDIVLLRISQDEKWQAAFKKQYSKPFHKLSDVEKQQVLASMPDMLLGAEKQAEALNRGLISPQNLVMSGTESTSSFTDQVGRKPAAQSFAAGIANERAAAAQTAQVNAV